jgi:peptidoglycan LD-endopeptidase LytH
MRRLALALVALTMAVPMLPVGAQVSPADVEEARQELRRVSERLTEQVGRYEAALAREALLGDRLDRMMVQLAARESDLVVARRVARDRAAEMYMTAGAGSTALISVSDVGAFPARIVYLESVSHSDRDAMNRLEMSRRDFESQRDLVDAALADQAVVRAEMESLLAVIYGELEEANDRYQAINAQWLAQEEQRLRREEEERIRREFLATSTTTTTTSPGAVTTVPPPTTTTVPPPAQPAAPPQPAGTRACPVDGAHSFVDTWGAPRSGGRTHTGQDLMAPHGTPLVAIEAGVVYQSNWHWAGGNQVYILGESGGLWFYAHLASPAIVAPGSRVEAGQRIGAVGSSGNASIPNLHFGWYPGGSLFGALANPYSILRSVC